MSAESYAEERFVNARRDRAFVARLRAFGVGNALEVVVVADSTPVGEVVERLAGGGVFAVADDEAPHGFPLARVNWIDA